VKINERTKLMIAGAVALLALGGIVILVWRLYQTEQELSKPMEQVVQKTPINRQSFSSKSFNEKPVEQDVKTQVDKTTAPPDSPEEDVKEEDIKEFLAILDQMDNQESSEETVVDPKDELFLRRFQMTRAETEKRTAELEEELRYKVTRCVFLFTEGMKYINGPDPAMQKEGNKMYEEYNRLWEDLTAWPPKMTLYRQYMQALGRGNPLAEGGWLWELQKPLPKRIGGPLR